VLFEWWPGFPNACISFHFRRGEADDGLGRDPIDDCEPANVIGRSDVFAGKLTFRGTGGARQHVGRHERFVDYTRIAVSSSGTIPPGCKSGRLSGERHSAGTSSRNDAYRENLWLGLISPRIRPAARKPRVMSLVVPSQRAKAGRATSCFTRSGEISFICNPRQYGVA
jgi:hypothetical protein